MPAANGTLEERDGKPALRFERVLRHGPERVWRALTEPEEESAWHPTPARFEPRVGGRVEYVPGGHVANMPDGEVTDYDPPRLLGYIWTADGAEFNHLRFEIRPHADSLDGTPAPPEHGADSGPWPELNAEYQDRFGISPEEATPPPQRG